MNMYLKTRRLLLSLATLCLAILAACGGGGASREAGGATTTVAAGTDMADTDMASQSTTVRSTVGTTPTTTAAPPQTSTPPTTNPPPTTAAAPSLDELISIVLTLGDFPNGYTARFPGPSEHTQALDSAPCGTDLGTAGFTYALVNVFEWPYEQLGWPSAGVVVTVTSRVDVDPTAVDRVHAWRDEIGDGCSLTFGDLGESDRVLVEIEGGPGIDAAVAHLLIPKSAQQALYVVEFAASGHLVTLAMDASAPNLATVPQLAEPIVQAARDRIAAVFG